MAADIANTALQRVQESGWRRGFANVLWKENRDWWKSRRWWVSFIFWRLLLNSTVFITLFLQSGELPAGMEFSVEERERWVEGAKLENRINNATRTFVDFSGTALILGVIIVMQNVLIDEKRTGTAAWILSKPVSRMAFLVAKLVANGLAMFIIVVVAQWTLAYIQLSIAGGGLQPLGNFLLAAGIIGLNMLFYLTLMLMLGALLNNRGALIAIPIVGLFVTMYLSSNFPALIGFTPLPLVMGTLGNPQEGIINSLALQAVLGEPIIYLTPIIATCGWCVAFVAVTVWRFGREEF